LPKLKKLLLFSGIVASIVLIFILLSAGLSRLLPEEEIQEEPTLIEPPEPRVNTVTVERGDIREEVSGLSRVAATKEAPVYFTESGRISQIFVDYEDWVEEGDPLARLEVGDLEHRYQLARIDMERVRLRKERQSNFVGETISEFDYRMTELDYERQKLQYDRIRNSLEEATIYAPISGEVISISMQEANTVEEYSEVVRIADSSELELQMNVSRGNLNNIVSGMEAEVRLADGDWVDAEVTMVPSRGAELPTGEPDRRVRLKISDKEEVSQRLGISEDEIINFGQLLSTYIILREEKDTLLLPKAAVREYGDRTFVRVQDGDVRKEVDIKTGLESDTRLEILEGLEEGDVVITR